MNEEEFALVQALAVAQGVSVPRALIESVAGKPVVTRTERFEIYRELFATRRLLANTTNHANRIARVLNSGGDVDDVDDREIRAMLERATAVVRRIGELKDPGA